MSDGYEVQRALKNAASTSLTKEKARSLVFLVFREVERTVRARMNPHVDQKALDHLTEVRKATMREVENILKGRSGGNPNGNQERAVAQIPVRPQVSPAAPRAAPTPAAPAAVPAPLPPRLPDVAGWIGHLFRVAWHEAWDVVAEVGGGDPIISQLQEALDAARKDLDDFVKSVTAGAPATVQERVVKESRKALARVTGLAGDAAIQVFLDPAAEKWAVMGQILKSVVDVMKAFRTWATRFVENQMEDPGEVQLPPPPEVPDTFNQRQAAKFVVAVPAAPPVPTPAATPPRADLLSEVPRGVSVDLLAKATTKVREAYRKLEEPPPTPPAPTKALVKRLEKVGIPPPPAQAEALAKLRSFVQGQQTAALRRRA